MQLSPQRFGKIIGTLREAAQSGGSDKRRLTRMEVQARVQVAALTGSTVTSRFTALTKDISMGGAGVFQAVPRETGSRQLIELPEGNGKSALLVAIVMHSRTVANGIFALGLEFISDADADLTAKWLNSTDEEQKRIRESMFG